MMYKPILVMIAYLRRAKRKQTEEYGTHVRLELELEN
jgi:hypothetical protein